MQKVIQKTGIQKTEPTPRRARCCGTDSYRDGSYAKHGRFWAVTDAAGQLICLAVYKKGAQEVLRRLNVAKAAPKRRTRPRRKQAREQRGN